MKYIANCSFGKDSTAMVLKIIENKLPLDIVVFYNTGMEFDGVYQARDKILPILKQNNIEYVELKPEKPFLYWMLEHKITKRNGSKQTGYGWCGGMCRWGTRHKISVINKFMRKIGECVQYVGIAYDELNRLEREENKMENKKFPLIDLKMTEKDCLEFCYKNGIDFCGKYKFLNRMSCWCCRNKNLKELKQYYLYMPDYWNKLVELENKIGDPMKKGKKLTERCKEWVYLK